MHLSNFLQNILFEIIIIVEILSYFQQSKIINTNNGFENIFNLQCTNCCLWFINPFKPEYTIVIFIHYNL